MKEETDLKNGLSKIEDTKIKVEELTNELVDAKKTMDTFQKQCEEYLTSIVQQKREADEYAKSVSQKSEKIAEEEIKCRKMAEVAQADLAEAMPALEEARKALEALNKRDLTEIKTYGKPPLLVEKVMEAVMILRGNEPSWQEAKKQLGDQNFIKQLVNFDIESVSDKCLKKISAYCIQSDFQPEIVGRVSIAAKSLCMWVRAIEHYAKIFRVVEPKRLRLQAAENHLKEKLELLEEAKRKLNEVENKMRELKELYEIKLKTKEDLKKQTELMELKLERASHLLEGLAGEKDRWQETLQRLENETKILYGNVLLTSSFINYLGLFYREYRVALEESWHSEIKDLHILHSENLEISTFLYDPTTIRDWNLQGLPSDKYFIENSFIVMKNTQWSLMIDPQYQGFKWIKNIETPNGVQVVDIQSSDFIKSIENAIVTGFPIILENLTEKPDQLFFEFINHLKVVKGEEVFIKFGMRILKMHPSFRVYFVTKLNKPEFDLKIYSKLNLIDFSINERGLQNQFLVVILKKERPELEEQKDNLVKGIAKNKKRKKQLNDDILKLLNESEGSLLDDEQLLTTLQSSKAISQEINENLLSSETTETKIDETREKYRACAERASILFFALNEMTIVDPMYKFPLDNYIDLFNFSIEKSHKSSNVEERVANLNEFHTYAVYRYACRSLFERHKLIFSFHMCIKIMKGSGKINSEEYNFFLKGGIVYDRDSQMDNPCPWLPLKCWDNITELDKLSNFHGLVTSFEQYQKDWNTWYTNSEPEQTTLPDEWDISCNELQRILIVRAMRQDRVFFCVTSFITNNLGSKFVEPPILNLKSVFDESTFKTPLIFVLSLGVDPTNDLISLAESKGMIPGNFFSLFLGQGQTELALKYVNKGIKEGHWIFLANCHLSITWLKVLEKLMKEIQNEKIPCSSDFRLWLSSKPTNDFPPSILDSSLRMTTELPQGIKSNMKRMYSRINENQFSRSKHPEKYKKLLFSLIFFHAIINERTKFGSLGWNTPYRFSDSDFEVCENVLNTYLDDYEETPFEALKFLIANIHYGGYLCDEWDKRLMQLYVSEYFCEEVLSVNFYRLSPLQQYYIPKDGTLNSYREYVSMLPNLDHPEVFGQHTNANITSQLKESRNLFETLISMEPNIPKLNMNEEEKSMDVIDSVMKILPDFIDLVTAEKVLSNDKSPLKTILFQEIAQYNKLLKTVKEELESMTKAVQGLILMTEELEAIYKRIIVSKIPYSWQKTYPSVKPLISWAKDLDLRVEQLRLWAMTTHYPKIFWISGFISPNSFLVAALQGFSRIFGLSIDLLGWEFIVMTVEDSNIPMAPQDSVLLNGFYLQGAGWDWKNGCITESEPMQLTTPMPTIQFKPIEIKRRITKGLYFCPCFYYPNRELSSENSFYVLTIDLKTGEKSPEHWIKRGTALLMSLDL